MVVAPDWNKPVGRTLYVVRLVICFSILIQHKKAIGTPVAFFIFCFHEIPKYDEKF